MKHKAFSLIELSIVILIIGILVAGVTQSSRMVREFRKTSARTLTKSSPVNSIKGLVSWYESTLEESFRSTIDADNSANNYVDTWYDIATTVTKNNGTQSTSTNQPIYVENSINGLPAVKFDGSDDYLNLPNGTVPYGNSAYSVFIVFKPTSICTCGFLGSGNYGTTNATNAFRYDSGGFIVNYWWDIDILTANDLLTNNTVYLADFLYNQSERNIYLNGVLKKNQSDSNNGADPINNTIGKTYDTEYMNGYISEIIIFNRSLNNEERTAVEGYLGKKWNIKLS